jgi:D-glycero-alpha-D-manno-heptose-7-phosphate kinase
LGSSGALGVALVAALDRAAQRSAAPVDLAERAWRLEAVEAGLPGGRQDQYAAALGGFHVFEFTAELVRHLVVCYTGQSRVSGETISRVMAKYIERDRGVTAALVGLVETAEQMAEALRKGDAGLVGRLLTANWRHQQALDPGMQTPLMAKLEAAMASLGALGGKAAGAGAGGSMFFLIDGDPQAARGQALAEGMRVLPLTWSPEGARVW